MSRISVIIPTRCRPKLLTEAVRHATAQSLPPAEVVVVYDDDRIPPSSDALEASGLVVGCTGGHLGVSAARNHGYRLASCPWLAFLDDDDWWLPSYLERAMAIADASDANLVCTDFLTTSGSVLHPEKDAPADLHAADCFGNNPGVRGSNLLIHRRLYDEVGGFDESLPAFNDLDFALRLTHCESLRYARLAEALVVFRKHNGPRLTSRRSLVVEQAAPIFITRHSRNMTDEQRSAFKHRLKRYWQVELPA